MRGPERENEAQESRLLLNAHMSIISVVVRFFPPILMYLKNIQYCLLYLYFHSVVVLAFFVFLLPLTTSIITGKV